MTFTDDMQKAIDIIQNTNESIYITGKAGTGKTTFLKYIVENIHKNFIVTAPTGVAAVNAGGVTLHSFLGIPIGVLAPGSAKDSKFYPSKKMLANAIDALIIDEVSMVRADVMDFVDTKLRMYRKNSEPFGGVQLIMFGDLHQLPPVVTSAEKEIVQSFYRGPYFFNAAVFREKGFRVVELTKVFRQSDDKFIKILNNIRDFKLTPEDMDELEALRDKSMSADYSSDYIHICSHRNDVMQINQTMLGEFTHEYTASLDGDFNPNSMPCDQVLQLRVGARVMSLTNDKEHRYFNGSLGVVTDLDETSVEVFFDNGHTVRLDTFSWEQAEYQTKTNALPDGTTEKKIERLVKGNCRQIPLTLAWAITIHKSQGLTFDHIVIHSKRMFCPGQLYVALSRCTSLEGIVSDSFISSHMIFPDYELSCFENACKANNNIFDRHAYRMMHPNEG